jgi:hypothetical protein
MLQVCDGVWGLCNYNSSLDIASLRSVEILRFSLRQVARNTNFQTDKTYVIDEFV